MAKYIVEDTSLIAVADAIRAKTGKTEELTLAEMPAEIASVPSTNEDKIKEVIDGTITSINNSDATEVNNYAFYSCKKLTTVNLPNVTNIKGSAFSSCTALTSISIPKVKTIYANAFADCTQLTSVTLPASLTLLQNFAFSQCDGLITVTIKATTPPKLGTNVFKDCSALTAIKVPFGCGDAYKAATNWSVYADLIVEEVE